MNKIKILVLAMVACSLIICESPLSIYAANTNAFTSKLWWESDVVYAKTIGRAKANATYAYVYMKGEKRASVGENSTARKEKKFEYSATQSSLKKHTPSICVCENDKKKNKVVTDITTSHNLQNSSKKVLYSYSYFGSSLNRKDLNFTYNKTN